MSQGTALAKAQALKSVLLAHGVPEVSIELMQGRPVSGDRWDSLGIVTNFFHHTVSSYKPTSLTPVLALCKTGRSDVPGPLCNGYGGWDLCYRIITFGYANHPGAGGPISVPRASGGLYRIPKDSARKYAWGTEFEGGIEASDWDRVLRNPRNGKTMTFREFMGRVGAGVQDYFNIPLAAHLEHKTWTTRKSDRVGYSAVSGIAEIKRFSNTIKPPVTKPPATKEDEDVSAYTPDQIKQFAGAGVHGQKIGRSGVTIGQALDTTRKNAAATNAAVAKMNVQLAALTAAVNTLATRQNVDAAQIKAAIDSAVNDAMEGLQVVLKVDNDDA